MNPIEGANIEGLTHQYLLTTQNLANASTTGFKRRLAVFQEALEAQADGEGAARTVNAGTAVDFSQGGLVRTGRTLDLALAGDGFFVVESPEAAGGVLYTRNGAFRTNGQRQLVDAAGRLVAGEGGPIVLPTSVGLDRVSVSSDGTVSAGGQAVGKLRLAAFADPRELKAVGASLFEAPAGVLAEAPQGTKVHQGFQEASNVATVEELVTLIMVTRLYEAGMKTISAQDERMKNLIQVAMSS